MGKHMLKKIAAQIIKKIIFEIQCKRADDWWYMTGGSCFGVFPPSFYMKHTPEEAERITKEYFADLHARIDNMKKKHDIDSG